MRQIAVLVALLCATPARAEFVLTLPLGASETYSNRDESLDPSVPIGPFANGEIAFAKSLRPVRRSVWRFGGDQTLRAVEETLRAQLDQSGYELVLDCATRACGGFDFRFGIEVVDPPAMYVDLRDFRFLSARLRTTEAPSYLSFLLSRSPEAVYLQMMEYGGATRALVETESTLAANPDLSELTVQAEPETPTSFVIEGLEFATGSSQLGQDPMNSLTTLSKYLKENVKVSVLLVGHSDLSGNLDSNIRLSRARAEAVRAALIDDFGIDGARLSAYGVGPLSPRADNATEAGKEKNRRVEAVFSFDR